MQYWEYKSVTIYPGEDLVEKLNTFGASGWEAFQMFDYQVGDDINPMDTLVGYAVYIKRPMELHLLLQKTEGEQKKGE